jgi:drug/metabolite transporter (DMT)-like permease
VLGSILAILSAATFALNNAAARRGVVTGTPTQGMVVTVPIGVICFLPMVVLTGGTSRLVQFPTRSVAWLALGGVVHFLLGRYCNYRASQAAGTNLTAPVVQLQVVVTLTLAVLLLHEPCTVLQMIGGAVMLAGALLTQRLPRAARAALKRKHRYGRKFEPHQLAGYMFASIAALAYGATPIMVRTALMDAGPLSGLIGGLIAYTAATLAIVPALLSTRLRNNILALKRENLRWFVWSGIFVAAAQGLFYSAVAVAPIMVVVPLTQLALVFRLLFSLWLNPDHEVFGPIVIIGSIVSVLGACAVSLDTALLLQVLAVPEGLAHLLSWRV